MAWLVNEDVTKSDHILVVGEYLGRYAAVVSSTKTDWSSESSVNENTIFSSLTGGAPIMTSHTSMRLVHYSMQCMSTQLTVSLSIAIFKKY